MGVLLSVAFFTLIERKLIGLIHYRKGPNKVLLWGLTQPIADAVKLLTKESYKLSSNKMFIFFTGPSIRILLIFLCWGWYDFLFHVNTSNLKIIIILALIRLTAYGFLLIRWGSNSKYSLLGGHRAVSQIISYEVCLVLFILVCIYISKNYNIETIYTRQSKIWIGIRCLPLLITWLMICIAERNRTPFDLAEGESEIVSGFNIEYGGGMFALIFIREYGIIMFLRFITSLLFLGASLIILKTFLICFLFIWVRSSFPRVRYDKLIIIAWKVSLPYRLCILMASTCVL